MDCRHSSLVVVGAGGGGERKDLSNKIFVVIENTKHPAKKYQIPDDTISLRKINLRKGSFLPLKVFVTSLKFPGVSIFIRIIGFLDIILYNFSTVSLSTLSGGLISSSNALSIPAHLTIAYPNVLENGMRAGGYKFIKKATMPKIQRNERIINHTPPPDGRGSLLKPLTVIKIATAKHTKTLNK